MYAEVVLSKATPQLDRIYHYRIPDKFKDKLEIGHQVAIPFGRRETIGYVVGFVAQPDVPVNLIRDILSINSEFPLFCEKTLKLAKWMTEYYGCFFISALRTIMPPGTSQKEKILKKKGETGAELKTTKSYAKSKRGLSLTDHQKKALEMIVSSLKSGLKETILLYGVTGSGKTEVYMQSIAEVLKNGQGAIVLVPEISLTPQLIGRFKERFTDHIAILHSALTLKQRESEWAKIAKGEARIVLGTRSAIFAPIKELGLIVIDEEFEQTYKQEKNPRYHVRDIAAQLNATVVLGSATPSIETYHKAKTNEFKLAVLPERIDKRPLPPVEIIDMREEKDAMLSGKLRREITETLARGEKVILFMNRRGYFTFSICRECGQSIECPRCSISLVYHSDDKKLRCGHCDFETEAALICPKCHSSFIGFFGIGTQRIEKEVAGIYRDARILRLDRDAVIKRGSHEKIFAAFAEGEANVLIGTQLVTKGLDAAKVTLVGVVSADTSLNLPDFRAAERTFQQLTQVAGRAGRHNLPGKVIIQTYNPDHYALKHVLTHDYEGFYREEIEYRKNLFFPPFSRLINLVVQCRNEIKAQKTAEKIVNNLESKEKIIVLGPAKAPISKIRGQYRHQILLKGENISALKKTVDYAFKKSGLTPDIRVTVDIDPLNML